jgi:hypothetical protein
MALPVGTDLTLCVGPDVVLPGVYSHVVAVFDQSQATMKLYVNGILRGSQPVPANLIVGVNNEPF